MLSELKQIPIADYDYPLPEERIAKYPLEQRDHSKLLCLKGDDISETTQRSSTPDSSSRKRQVP